MFCNCVSMALEQTKTNFKTRTKLNKVSSPLVSRLTIVLRVQSYIPNYSSLLF